MSNTTANGNLAAYAALLVLCLVSRALSSIYYIEDPDSLRFALAVIDYDVSSMQPHFPGYPVFCFLVKVFHALTGRIAIAFSLVGGISLFILILSTLGLWDVKIRSWTSLFLSFLLIFNPLIWLLGNRYMPDLFGCACLMASLYFLVRGREDDGALMVGLFLAGLLPGIRLSFLPFLAPALALTLLQARPYRSLLRLGFALLAGALIWLLPMIGLTGWDNLLAAAAKQSSGHFFDFGGTINTESSLTLRLVKLWESIWADSLGAWWPMRSPLTIPTALVAPILLYLGLRRRPSRGTLMPLFLGGLLYLVWIFLFQNVIHKPRHVLPLIPLLLGLMAMGSTCRIRVSNLTSLVFPGILLVFSTCYAAVTLTLVHQHRKPTAIAQAREYIAKQADAETTILSIPLVHYYLSSQGIRGRYAAPEAGNPEILSATAQNRKLVTIGDYRSLIGREPKTRTRFYHNPYVNRMWSEVEVQEYGPEESHP